MFVKYKLSEEVFKESAKDPEVMKFRKGAKEFITFLHDHNIPLIIISSGIGNFIECFLENNNCYYDNIYVSSNKIVFKNGIAVGVEKDIIHSLNKNEASLPESINKKIENLDNCILLGDQINDIKMVNPGKNILSVSFVASDNQEYIDKFSETYDIVLDGEDDDFAELKNILF